MDYNSTTVFGDLRQETIKSICTNAHSKAFHSDHIAGTIDKYGVCRKCSLRPLP